MAKIQSGFCPTQPEAGEEAAGTVNVAEALLRLDAARKQGLLTNGPVVPVDECVAALRFWRALAVEPCRPCVQRIIAAAVDSDELDDGFAERFAAKLCEELTLIY